MINNELKKYFDENGYIHIQNFLKPEMFSLLYEYTKMKARREVIKEAFRPDIFNTSYDGRFIDPQAPGSYALYGDPLMDALLQNSTKFISDLIQIELIPTYSYWRLYITNNLLEKHQDRPSCQYSGTLCLGYDISNMEDKNYSWPFFVKSLDNKENSINLKPGDLIIYKGCEIEHWRDAFKGLNHSQVFLHFNEKNGQYNVVNDGRLFLGLPSIIDKNT
jgi:hypothetical protein